MYDNLGIEVFLRSSPPYDLLAGVAIGRPKFLIASDGGYPPQQRFRSNGLPGVGAPFFGTGGIVDAKGFDTNSASERIAQMYD